MLVLSIPKRRLWNEANQEFVYTDELIVELEHNLISVCKWESKWKRFFTTVFDGHGADNIDIQEFNEMFLDYIRCMVVKSEGDLTALQYLSKEQIDEILNYMNDSQTATVINDRTPENQRRKANTQMSAEYIYAMMILSGIPKEFETWHFNKLMTLIQLVQIVGNPDKKKMSQKEVIQDYAKINAAYQAKLKAAKKGKV